MGLFRNLQKELAGENSAPYSWGYQDPPFEDKTLTEQLGGDVTLYDDVLRKDGHANAVLAKVESGIIAQGFEVVPASDRRQDKKVAQLVQDIFDRGIEDDVCRAQWDVVGKGHAFAEVFWTQDGGLILPYEVVPRPQYRFRFELLSETDRYNANITKLGGYGVKLLTKESPMKGEWLKQDKHRKILAVSFGSRTGNPYGRGLYECAYWLAIIRKQLSKFALVAADKYASPIPFAIFEPGTQETVVEDFLQNISQGAWGKLPEGVQVSFMEAAKNGISDYHKLINLFADEMSKLFLGSTLTVQLGEVGSFAAAQQHSKEEDKAVQSYCRVLCDPLNNLARWITELNYPSANPPLVVVKKSQENLDARAVRDDLISVSGGYFLDLDYLKNTYGVEFSNTQRGGSSPNTLPPDPPTEPAAPSNSDNFSIPIPDNDKAIDTLVNRGVEQSAVVIQQWNETIAEIFQDIATDPKFAGKKDSAKYAEASRRIGSALPDLPSQQFNEIMSQVMTLGNAIGQVEMKEFVDGRRKG